MFILTNIFTDIIMSMMYKLLTIRVAFDLMNWEHQLDYPLSSLIIERIHDIGVRLNKPYIHIQAGW